MSGLFVQKHAEAVRAQGVDVRVIHSQGWCDLWRQWQTLQREGWMPDAVQLNVIQKQGLLALRLKKHYGIPYIIVEHWSGYLPENGGYKAQSPLKKHFAERICHEADIILTVSPMLERAMQACGLKAMHWGRINNVVDDFFYSQYRNTEIPKILLHVSCFDERAKNISALLRGFAALCERRSDVRLIMVGTGVDWQASYDLARDLHIPDEQIVWTGEQTPEQVCKWLQQSGAFVLTSRYETAGIVLSEAAATGTPILSTPVGIAEEIIIPETGIIVSQENVNRPKRLSEYMEAILAMSKYSSRAQEYRAGSVGRQLKEIYDSCLHYNI